MITIMYYNHAQARKALLEKGREILVKDNMIDEEKARAEAAAHETASETVTRLEAELEAVVAAMGDMMDKYRGLQVIHCHYSALFCNGYLLSNRLYLQATVKQRITEAEKKNGLR